VLRQVLESSSLRSIGYDRATATLDVECKNGGVYLRTRRLHTRERWRRRSSQA
jgi:hypothetical protein